jgi:ribose 5-phosphate isomerase RpiB
MRVGIATDHGGFGLKEELLGRLRAAGHEVVDLGPTTSATAMIILIMWSRSRRP